MKNLKLLIILFALFGSLAAASAQRVVKVYPRHGTVVTHVVKPRIVVHKGISFHYSNGVWYKPYGKRFVVSAAPAGIKVRFLPRGHRMVVIRGKRYYAYKGVYYKKRGRYYKVVYV